MDEANISSRVTRFKLDLGTVTRESVYRLTNLGKLPWEQLSTSICLHLESLTGNDGTIEMLVSLCLETRDLRTLMVFSDDDSIDWKSS
jgi:hypothetical protein